MWPACWAKELLIELLKEALKDKEHENMRRWEESIEMEFNEHEESQSGLYSSLARDQMVGCCEHDNKTSDFIKCREFMG